MAFGFLVLDSDISELVGLVVEVASRVELAVFETENNKVVKFLGLFKYSTKDKEVFTHDTRGVARARKRLEVRPVALDIDPSFLRHVEFPHIAEFARVIILTTEGVKAVILNTDGHTGAHSRLNFSVGVAEDLSMESHAVEVKAANLIYTGTVDEATEGYKGVFTF